MGGAEVGAMGFKVEEAGLVDSPQCQHRHPLLPTSGEVVVTRRDCSGFVPASEAIPLVSNLVGFVRANKCVLCPSQTPLQNSLF